MCVDTLHRGDDDDNNNNNSSICTLPLPLLVPEIQTVTK